MKTVLQPIEHTTTGAPSAEEIKHDEVAKAHFLQYCDSGKCVGGSEQSKKSNWHDNGFCADCCFNPYNMAPK